MASKHTRLLCLYFLWQLLRLLKLFSPSLTQQSGKPFSCYMMPEQASWSVIEQAGAVECVTDVLRTFWHPLWFITVQSKGTMESTCFIQWRSKNYCCYCLHLPLWWTLFKPFFLNIILTHVTKGLGILCLWLSILGGADVRFTQEPSNPSYFKNGSDAKLVCDYTDPLNATRGIIFSVLVKDTYKKLFSGAVVVSKNIVIFLHLIKEELKLKEELPC